MPPAFADASAADRAQVFVMKAGIIRHDRVLILTSAVPGHGSKRDLPGGKLIYGEDPFSALRREVLEETGLSIRPVAPVRVWAFTEADGVQYIGITVACHSDSDTVRLSQEHSDYSWLSRQAIPADWPEREELLAVFDCVDRGARQISAISGRAWPEDASADTKLSSGSPSELPLQEDVL